MASLTEQIANMQLDGVLMITTWVMAFFVLLGLAVSDFVSLGRLFRTVLKAHQSAASIASTHPNNPAKQLYKLAVDGQLGVFSNPVKLSVVKDDNDQVITLSNPGLQIDADKIISQFPGRFWAVPIFFVTTIIGVVGITWAVLIQLVKDPGTISPIIFLYSILFVLLLSIFRTIDSLFVHFLKVKISNFTNYLVNNFPISNELQIQQQILISQRQLKIELQAIGPDLNSALTETVQKNWVPAVRNMSQSFDAAIKHLNDEQQHGMGKLAGHFARQLDQSLGEHLTSLTDSIEKVNLLHQASSERITTLLKQLDQTAQIQNEAHVQTRQLVQSIADARQSITDSSTQLEQTFTGSSEKLADIFANSSTGLVLTVNSLSEKISSQSTDNMTALNQILTTGADQLRLAYSEGAEHLNEVLKKSSEMTQEVSTLLINGQAEAARLREEQTEVQGRISDYFEQMRNQINRLQDDLQANLVDIFSKFTDLTSVTLTQSDEQSQQMLSHLTEQSTQLMNTLDDQVRELSFLVRDVASEISGLNKTLDQSVQQFGEQLSETTSKTFDSFDQGLNDIVAHLSNTIELISDSVDDLPAAVISVRDWVDSNRTRHDSDQQ